MRRYSVQRHSAQRYPVSHCLLALLSLFLLATAAMAQYGSADSQANSAPSVRLRGRSYSDLYAAQRTLISSYCRLDFEGARLLPKGWERFKPYASMRFNPDFNRVMVVTRFDIEAPGEASEELDVVYRSVGYYRLGEGYTQSAATLRAGFLVEEQNGNLLVTTVKPETPFVSPKAALEWMNRLLNDPQTSDFERAHLKDALNQLSKYAPQTPPAAGPGKS